MANIKFLNEDCLKTMQDMVDNGKKVDIILTSPPYNTGRTTQNQRSIDNYENRYDIHLDNMTDDEYRDWTVKLFKMFDKILKENCVVLYNISYGNENPNIMWHIPNDIIEKTPFMIADRIIWKKKSALPNNVSHNKLTRIVEDVFVICRKNEYKTFNTNKTVKSVSKTGQKYYENVFNFVDAKNNDGPSKLNKATYSSELCEKLLSLYAVGGEGYTVYDPFMGTGTTGIACEKMGFDCIGSELSPNQVEESIKRLNVFRNGRMPKQLTLF